MGKRTKYDELKDQIAEAVKKSGGTRYSKADHTAMTQALINSPEQEVEVYMKDVETPISTKPVARYRDSLKPMLKQFGVDDAELDKVQTMQFTKEHAEALNDVSAIVTKDYINTGRKLVMPITSATESQMEISQTTKPQKTEETRKPVKKDDGTYESVPTGKKKTTFEHTEIKASNKIPSWLQEESDV